MSKTEAKLMAKQEEIESIVKKENGKKFFSESGKNPWTYTAVIALT